jgi:hypothetical protein
MLTLSEPEGEGPAVVPASLFVIPAGNLLFAFASAFAFRICHPDPAGNEAEETCFSCSHPVVILSEAHSAESKDPDTPAPPQPPGPFFRKSSSQEPL